MSEFTTYLNLFLPNFNNSPWHDEVNYNFRAIDAALNSLTGIVADGVWQNSTAYTIGQKLFDEVDGSLWRCAVDHTSRASGVMSLDRAAHPTYWETSSASQSAVLDAIAALSPVNGDFVMFTSGSVATRVNSTSAGRSMLTASNALVQKSLLGLSTVATSGAFSDLSGTGSVLMKNVQDQTFTGGLSIIPLNLGTTTGSNIVLDMGDGPLQYYTNNGAHAFAPGSDTGMIIVDITNGASAGAISLNNWTRVIGDSFSTTNGHKFRCFCSVSQAGSLLIIQAMQ